MPNIAADGDKIDERTDKKFCALIYEKAGINLGANKEALVSARVGKRMRQLGFDDYRKYYKFAEEDKSGAELVELLNVISTNVTHFFREEAHFERLRRVVNEWELGGQKRFRIWSAASSTGEEPYTIAITLTEALQNLKDVRILATDLSTKVLDIAKKAEYELRHVDKIPRAIRAGGKRRVSKMAIPRRVAHRC